MIFNSAAKYLYIIGGGILGENVDKHLEFLKKSQWFSTDKLKELQWFKLKSLLEHSYNNSPYYRKIFDENGIKLQDINAPQDLGKIPVLTKDDLRIHYKELVVNNGHYKYSIAKSSGSTGQAVKFYKDRNASGNGRAAMYRGHNWYNVDIGDREARLWGVPLNLKGKISAKIGDLLLNRFREKKFYLTEDVMVSFYNNMKIRKPHYLMGYSSLVYEFALFLSNREIDASLFNLKMVKVTAETLHDYQRTVIEKTFQCPLAIEYGAAEVGLIAFECPFHGLHITIEGVFIEELNTSTPSLKELIITDLNNYYTPIIRYQLGDYGSLSNEMCSCGRGLPLLREVVGRTNDIAFTIDGKPIHSSIFSYILKDITGRNGGIKQYKIYQRNIGALEFEIIKDSTFSISTEDYLKKKILENFGRETRISIRYVDVIEREPSGKLRYFVSKISDHNKL